MEELWHQMKLKRSLRSCERFLDINQNTIFCNPYELHANRTLENTNNYKFNVIAHAKSISLWIEKKSCGRNGLPA